jgi:hypothetical protein
MNIKDLATRFEGAKNRIIKHSTLQISHNADLCEIVADGCRRVVSCDSNIVIFEQPFNRTTITGHELKLRNWGVDGVVVSGRVMSVEFAEVKNG